MNEKYTEHNEMTNAEFLEEIKCECENDEEFKEEIKEITGIFIRAIAKGYPNFENREDFENEIKKRGY
jgi:hypothetical protein